VLRRHWSAGTRAWEVREKLLRLGLGIGVEVVEVAGQELTGAFDRIAVAEAGL
jgi:hypothetical protein